MGSQAKTSKNSKFFENIQDRTLFLRKISQDNHVRRMNLARVKGEALQANFVKPSNFSKLELNSQNNSEIDSRQKPLKKTDTRNLKRSPFDKGKTSKVIRSKTNNVKVPRRKYSPFVMLNTSDPSTRVFCFPVDNAAHTFSTPSKDETPRKSHKYGDKTEKIKYIKDKFTNNKSYKKESTKENFEDKDANDYQPQKLKKPPRLKNIIKSTKRKFKSKIEDLAYEEENQYPKAGLCKGFIRSKTCFDTTKDNIASPQISRPTFKDKISQTGSNIKLVEKFMKSSGDSTTVLNEYTQTDLTLKKSMSSEINLCDERPGAKTRSSSLDPLGDKRYRSRKELSPAPLKSKIPIALSRIKQVKEGVDKKDKGSKGPNKNQRPKFVPVLESKRGDPVSKLEKSVNRRSLYDKFLEKQKCVEPTTEKKCFEFPFPQKAEVCNKPKDRKCIAVPSSDSEASDYNLTDWSEFIEKFDQEYKRDNKIYATDLPISNEKITGKPEKGSEYLKTKELEKYIKDIQPGYDFLQSPIEKLMKEIKSAINIFNDDDEIINDEPQSNLSGTQTEFSEKEQKKKKAKKGKRGGWKKKALRKNKA